tara:strand:+ start:14813 stop:15985 length:1173 start_codon:yes stop_codon:yes gene_type:complete
MRSNKDYVFTSESVSEGHPDKVCDQISDTILDLYLSVDSSVRVACETLATTNKVILSGEVSNIDLVDNIKIEETIRNKIKKIGYDQDGFSWKTVDIKNFLHNQSKDIAVGVDEIKNVKEQGAGDQGIMFGYACTETENFMPAPIEYAHNILKNMAIYRHQNNTFLGPDSKSQVSIIYENNQPIGVSSVVVSTQHSEDVSNTELKNKVFELIKTSLPKDWMPHEKDLYINPTGRFVIGGPDGDTGLTGRKIVVDTYGGAAPHGGGAFSGKDQTKVDRSAAYIARYLAKNVVASKIAKKCLIQLSYAIGVSKPVSLYIETDEESKVNINKLTEVINKNMDLTPSGIRQFLKLDTPFYSNTSVYGHFGRKPCNSTGCFSWEKLDFISDLKKYY